MKQYRDDVRRHAISFGRNPDDIKVLFLVYPILAETDAEAQAKRHRMVSSPHFIERALASTATVTDIDFSKYDLDQPLPRLTTNGEQGSLDKFAQWGSNKTLRQLAMERFGAPDSEVDFVGTPDTVAERMENAMETIGGDGFLISTPFQRTNRRLIVEVTEGLVPALQRRGLMRTTYRGRTLREVLTEY
jgi:alkanesulfonate monooxygenase SsuD/methylene tetrahydromethanopterin reductase-like flavin-dependent oxidoreductase (luciferase family)